jgi:hypothetical protein
MVPISHWPGLLIISAFLVAGVCQAQQAQPQNALSEYQSLLSKVEERQRKHEVTADPHFFLLPQRMQMEMLKERAANLKTGFGIVYLDEKGVRQSAGMFKDRKNGLRLHPGIVARVTRQIGEEDAATFKAKFEKQK